MSEYAEGGRGLACHLGVACSLRADAEEIRMTLCPVAIAVGCKKCPAFRICPLKTVIGDYRPEDHSKRSGGGKAAKAGKRSK